MLAGSASEDGSTGAVPDESWRAAVREEEHRARPGARSGDARRPLTRAPHPEEP